MTQDTCDKCGEGIEPKATRYELTRLDHEEARSATVEGTFCGPCGRALFYFNGARPR